MLLHWESTLLGVGLSTLGMFLSSVGNLLMRKAQLVNEANPTEKAKPFYCRPVWYIITLFLIGNGATDFAAFQFASMDVLAPLSAVATAVNFLVAFFLLGEIFAWNHAGGGLIMVCAAATAVYAGPKEPTYSIGLQLLKDMFLRPTYLAFLFVKLVILAGCVLIINFVKADPPPVVVDELTSPREVDRPQESIPSRQEFDIDDPDSRMRAHKQHVSSGAEVHAQSQALNDNPNLNGGVEPNVAINGPANPHREISKTHPSEIIYPNKTLLDKAKYQLRVIAWACLASGIGSWTNLLGKMFTKLIAASTVGDDQMKNGITWFIAIILICVAALQFKTQAMMMISFPAVQIMPTFNCFFIIHMIFEGGFFFREFEHFDSTSKKIIFGFAIPVCMTGIFVASWAPKSQKMRGAKDIPKRLNSEEDEADLSKKNTVVQMAAIPDSSPVALVVNNNDHEGPELNSPGPMRFASADGVQLMKSYEGEGVDVRPIGAGESSRRASIDDEDRVTHI